MDAPPIQYAHTADDVTIAYSVLGTGSPLLMPFGASDLGVQGSLRYAPYRDWYEALAQNRALILFDPRGRAD